MSFVNPKTLLETDTWKRVSLLQRSNAVNRAVMGMTCTFHNVPIAIIPADLAYNFPGVGGLYSYQIETSKGRDSIGYAVSTGGDSDDLVAFYILVCMADGRTLEVIRLANPGNVASLYMNGERLGTITTLEYHRGLPKAWEIRSETALIGILQRPGFIGQRPPLYIQRVTGAPIPVILARRPANIVEVFKTLGKLLTFPIWMMRPLPLNDDYVIPREAMAVAPEIPLWLHAAISVFFRFEVKLGFGLAFPY